MIVGVERYRQFITSTVLAAAVSVVWIGSGSAQTQEATAHEQSTADNSAAETSKQAANPLPSVWLDLPFVLPDPRIRCSRKDKRWTCSKQPVTYQAMTR